MTEQLRQIKHAFFAFRNGVVADMLRRNGDKHEYVMGCQLPDVSNICSRFMPSVELADALWADANHRECRMAATMLHPLESMTYQKALSWCTSLENEEIADLLCHRLLRKLDFAPALWRDLVSRTETMLQYTGLRLLLNLFIMKKESPSTDVMNAVAPNVEDSPGIKLLKRSILEEIDEYQPK